MHPSEDRLLKDVLLDGIAFRVMNAALLWVPISIAPAVESVWLRWMLIVVIFIIAPLTWPKLLDFLLAKAADNGWILRPAPHSMRRLLCTSATLLGIVHLAD